MSNTLNKTIEKLGAELAKQYPRHWEKTEAEQVELWARVDAVGRGIIMDGRGNLARLKNRIESLVELKKQLEKAAVADSVDSAK